MRIGRPLLKLPIRFCGETLAREVSALPASAWIDHPMKYDGNSAVPLVSPGGTINDDWSGPMGPTPWLRQCPFVMEIMQALDSTWGRSRFMGLAKDAVVPEHVDVHYYWRTHLRIHIPVITNPDVAFTCAGETINMQPGECWLLDSFFKHEVANRGTETRVHLVLDTVGSGRLWDLLQAALDSDGDAAFVAPGEQKPTPLAFEQINSPLIMSPWEMRSHVGYISEWTDEQPGRDETFAKLDRFMMAWSGTWARYGASEAGLPFYAQHLRDVHNALGSLGRTAVTMRNQVPINEVIGRFILANAIAPAMMQRLRTASPRTSIVSRMA